MCEFVIDAEESAQFKRANVHGGEAYLGCLDWNGADVSARGLSHLRTSDIM